MKTRNIYVKKYELMKNLEFQIFQQLKVLEHICVLNFAKKKTPGTQKLREKTP